MVQDRNEIAVLSRLSWHFFVNSYASQFWVLQAMRSFDLLVVNSKTKTWIF